MTMFPYFKKLAGAALALLLVCTLALPGLTAQAEAPASYSAQLNMKLEGHDLAVRLCADLENLVFSAQGLLIDEDGQVLAQRGLFYNGSAIAIQDTSLLEDTYGIDLSQAAANLPGSVFAPDSGSVLALDQQLYDALLPTEAADIAKESDGDVIISQDENDSLGIIGGADGPTAIFVTGDTGNLLSTLLKSVSTKTAPGELILDSGTIKTTETTITLDAKGMAKLAGTVLEQIERDPQAKAALEELLSNLPGDTQQTDLFTDLDKTVSSLEDALTQAGAGFTASIARDRKTKELLSVSASLACDGETLDFQAVLPESRCSLVRSGADGQASTANLKVEENTDDAFALRFHTTRNDEESSSIHFLWDKKAGTYVLTIKNGDETDELSGRLQPSENALVITADAANGQALEDCSLTLRRDDPAQMPQFQDILTMSEDSILQILHNVIQAVQNQLVGTSIIRY